MSLSHTHTRAETIQMWHKCVQLVWEALRADELPEFLNRCHKWSDNVKTLSFIRWRKKTNPSLQIKQAFVLIWKTGQTPKQGNNSGPGESPRCLWSQYMAYSHGKEGNRVACTFTYCFDLPHTHTHTYSSCHPSRRWPTSVPRFHQSACVGSVSARWPSRLPCAGAPAGRSCVPTSSQHLETHAGRPEGRTPSRHWAGRTHRRCCYRGRRNGGHYLKHYMQMYRRTSPEPEVTDRATCRASTPPTPVVISAFSRPRHFLLIFYLHKQISHFRAISRASLFNKHQKQVTESLTRGTEYEHDWNVHSKIALGENRIVGLVLLNK